MANGSPPDYKALFLRAEEEKRQAEERQRQAEEHQRQAEERQRQAEEHRQRAEQERDQEREQTRRTTFAELIRYCHSYTSLCLRVESSSRSTTGTVPAPKGKRCPLQLLPWTECTAIQQKIYHSVCTYLAPPGQPAAQLFPSRTVLKGFGEEFKKRAISSEQDLQSYERFGVENHVRDIIAELCKIRAAREEFQLGNGIQFDNHANALDAIDTDGSKTDKSANSRPDQYCIHRADGDNSTAIMTVEYKPPHKLSVENFRAGLRPMRFWNEV
ncbi:hypothetical protein AnigIFM63604_008109, partial [Aspergillus niger]